MFQKNDKVIIKENLLDELRKLGFTEDCILLMTELIGQEFTIFDIWEDEGQKYATVDLCVEIPLQCLRKVK